jgi:hypothetical protein
VAKSADVAIVKLHTAQARARRMHDAGLTASLAGVGEELSNLKQQNTATLDALSEALLKCDALEKQVARQTGELDKAQDTIAHVREHDAATTAGNRRLVFRIMIYRMAVSAFVAWIASKLVPALLPQFKLYAALCAGAATLGTLCWFL